jgi:hypothetical protein
MKRAKIIAPVSPNFVTNSTPMSDVENIITPEENEPLTFVDDNATMEDVLFLMGKFSSKSQARKNGWTGPIPDGFNVWQSGKDQFVTLNMNNIYFEYE